ncbi:uncharacterized protein PV06_00947 [Exophiala oligosperma]|uniref:Uncharacterized protein n=1 Tax=Exophiala oligosperma TaxID=215243 RepID=A0A0D2CEM6_9EURO|nr:uncharacterized protein PV06_00947 [Exophiala oligosperma]KIW48352.1 hypothetical protein PV06_00947 [Exophiala oligosperma]
MPSSFGADDIPASISLSSTTLRRFAGDKVDPYVRYVAFLLLRDLKIGVAGQRNMNNALSNLPVHMSVAPADKLSLGWGPSHVIYDRAVHEDEGSYDHLAVMLALTETFHETYGALVLMELSAAATAATPGEATTPHFVQWKAALHGCNGALASTDFGLLVEDYIQLYPYNIINVDHVESLIPPRVVAKAISALLEVTSGRQKQATFTGSAITSWIGAVAEWLCDLPLAVYQTGGQQLRRTHADQDPQITLVFVKNPGLSVSFEKGDLDISGVADLSLVDRTYSSAVHATPFGGRVAWQSLLPKVFGKSFRYLDHEESKAFATMMGSAAKMFEGLALGRGHEEHNELVSTQNQNNDASYGAGLIVTLTNWLPELRRFEGRMEKQLKLSHEDAAANYVEQLTRVRKACHCGICTAKEHLADGQEGVPPPHGYCLAVLVETIIALGLSLSRMTVSSRLYPTRSGIQSFYLGQVSKRLEARGKHWKEHFKIVYGNEWNAPDVRRLQNAIQIFTGSRPTKNITENLVAISHEGICAYFVAMEKGYPSEKVHQVQLIRVVSGSINVGEKLFDRACLGSLPRADYDDPWEQLEYDHLPKPLFCK